MSCFFNQLLLSPSQAELVSALVIASDQEPERQDRGYWFSLINEVVSNAEGRTQLEHSSRDGSAGSRYLTVAWWTDRQRRKHVRVVGGDTRAGADIHYSRLDQDLRPPVWHISPENVYLVERGAQKAWLVHCPSCGETGSADELGWVGSCCSICQDRRDDGEVVLQNAPKGIFMLQGTIRGLAFHPTDTLLAASTYYPVIIDLSTGQLEQLADDPAIYLVHAPVCYSHRGDWLASGAFVGMYLCLVKQQPKRGFVPLPNPESYTNAHQVEQLGFDNTGRFLASVDTELQYVNIWKVAGSKWSHQQRLPGRTFSFAADEPLLFVGSASGEIDSLAVGSWSPCSETIRYPVPQGKLMWLSALPNQRLLLLSGVEPATLETTALTASMLCVWDRSVQKPIYQRAIYCGAFAISPNGRFFAFTDNRPLQTSLARITIWDVQQWRQVGVLEWNPELQWTELCFSADGQTLASGSLEGVVKLWPWQVLLRIPDSGS